MMERILDWFRETYSKPATGSKSAVWQGLLHLAAVYAIARICTPWLLQVTHDYILPWLTGRPPRVGLQFFFAHQFAFSIVPGLIAGFFTTKLLHHRMVRFVWVIPVVVLAVVFVFTAPGMYPTMILQSDFRTAFHSFFGGDCTLPEYATYSELWKDTPKVFEMLFMYRRFRIVVPAYVGVAYSFGAWVSLYLSRVRVGSTEVKEIVA
jgi:hypothetical protein